MQHRKPDLELKDVGEFDDFVMLGDSSEQQTTALEKENKPKFFKLPHEALQKLWEMVDQDPEQLVYISEEPAFTVFRFDTLYVAQFEKIGAGFWALSPMVQNMKKTNTNRLNNV